MSNLISYICLKRTSSIEITEKGFLFYELGLIERRSKKEIPLGKFECVTPDTRPFNIVDVSSNSSSSAEEIPQDYKPAQYLHLNKK